MRALPGPAPGRPPSSSRPVSGNLSGGYFLGPDSIPRGLAFPAFFAAAAVVAAYAVGINPLWVLAGISALVGLAVLGIWLISRSHAVRTYGPHPDAEPVHPRPIPPTRATTVQVVEVLDLPRELTATPSVTYAVPDLETAETVLTPAPPR